MSHQSGESGFQNHFISAVTKSHSFSTRKSWARAPVTFKATPYRLLVSRIVKHFNSAKRFRCVADCRSRCRQRRNGNTPVAQERKADITPETIPRTLTKLAGTEITLEKRYTQSAKNNRTHGDCTTCTGTLGRRAPTSFLIMNPFKARTRKGHSILCTEP